MFIALSIILGLITLFTLIYIIWIDPKNQDQEKDIIGPKEVVIADLVRQGIVYRIEKEDDQHFALTMDYVPSRANLTIKKGMVISIRYG